MLSPDLRLLAFRKGEFSPILGAMTSRQDEPDVSGGVAGDFAGIVGKAEARGSEKPVVIQLDVIFEEHPATERFAVAQSQSLAERRFACPGGRLFVPGFENCGNGQRLSGFGFESDVFVPRIAVRTSAIPVEPDRQVATLVVGTNSTEPNSLFNA